MRRSAKGSSSLLPVLSAIAGAVDVIGFLTLKIFTAHITGNLVVIAAQIVRDGPPNMDQIIAVPIFIVAVACLWLISRLSGRRGVALTRLLLLVHLLLLTIVWIFSILNHPSANPAGVPADIAAMFAVSAMACQFALLQLAIPGAPSTAVMTGNLTKTVLSLLDTMWPRELMPHPNSEQLKENLALVFSFFLGCVAGAVASSWLRDWAWSFPVVLACAALTLCPQE
jgi:uncharacterized membrane protein YoaK (UPF0700 family)